MDAERWKRVEELYQGAMALQLPEKRAEFLREACPDDPQLRAEVQSLLDQETQGFLEESPLSLGIGSGTRIGSFEMMERIGQGGMGEVWRARDTRLNRDVAIKVLPSAFSHDAERIARFEHEARAASALNHPNVVSVFDVGKEDGFYWIVSELVEGESLHQRIGEGLISLHTAVDIAAQVAEGLAAAHHAGIVHRDLKPGNIMIRRDGRVKIVDFGLAKRARPGEDSVTLTKENVVLGTAGYMSPEQIRGAQAEPRSDIFSFGLVLHEMLAAQRAFSGTSSLELMLAIVKDDPSPLPASVPAVLSRIVRRCLEKDPERRFQSAADLAFALHGYSQPVAVAPETAKQSRRWLAWLVAAAVGAVLAAAFLWVRQRPGGKSTASGNVLWRLTNDSGLTKDGAISPDGKLAVYASDRAKAGNLDIWIQQIGQGQPARLTNDPADEYDPAFSPDGSRVVFRSERAGGGIYEVPVIGGEARLMLPRGRRPRFSPDGQFLMYSTGEIGPGRTGKKLFVLTLSSGASIPIGSHCMVDQNAAWSPDSRSILLSAGCTGMLDTFDIWTASRDGQSLRKTNLHNSFIDYDLDSPLGIISLDQWVPHPDRLLLPQLAGDVAYIGALPISADGMKAAGPLQRITYGAGSDNRVSASADGHLVISSVSRDSRVWGLRISEKGKALGEPSELTGGLSDGVRGVSRDGRVIAFIASLTNPTLYLKDLATGRQTAVSPKSADMGFARFDAAGTKVIFQACSFADVARSGWHTPYRIYEAQTSGGVAATKYFPNDEGNLWDVSQDEKLLYGPLAPHGADEIYIVDLQGEPRRTLFLRYPARGLWQVRLSNDGKWVTFNATTVSNSQVYIAPYRQVEVPRTEWIPVTGGLVWDDKPRFSVDDRTLFFLSDRDGFLCIWAQPLGKDMHPEGQPFAVYHSHQAVRSIENAPLEPQDLEVAPGMLVFAQTELSGNLWLLETAEQNKVRPGQERK